MIPFSVLDLAPIVQDGTAAESFRNTLDLAQHTERWGYHRFWLAEHHNMPGIASAATAVLIAYVGCGTSTIRVGAGGVMLPNHAPLQVAEQFGTLESLFPGRIDLGLGRAPGTDHAAAVALRRTLRTDPDEFPRDVVELMSYFRGEVGARVRAVPGAGLDVPIWILGSSLFGAQVAAALGLPFSFASHFAPAQLMDAIAVYRHRFQPSVHLDRPYVMLGVNLVAADSDDEARFLASSQRQAFTKLREGMPIQLPPPSIEWQRQSESGERTLTEQVLRASIVGSPATVRSELAAFIERTAADELIIATQVYEHAQRLRSYEIVAQVRSSL
jgi:luciferase family oxidoreductase group 1